MSFQISGEKAPLIKTQNNPTFFAKHRNTISAIGLVAGVLIALAGMFFLAASQHSSWIPGLSEPTLKYTGFGVIGAGIITFNVAKACEGEIEVERHDRKKPVSKEKAPSNREDCKQTVKQASNRSFPDSYNPEMEEKIREDLRRGQRSPC